MLFRRHPQTIIGFMLLILLLLKTSTSFGQISFLGGLTAGIGQSKLAPRPSPSFSGFERFPAYCVGVTTEIVSKGNPFSLRMDYWLEQGGDDGEGLREYMVPVSLKAAFGKTWAPYGFVGAGVAYVVEKSISYKDLNISALYGLGLEWKYNKKNRAYLQYIHLAGITSVYDELVTPIGGSQIRIENRHVRHYISLGILWTIGSSTYYTK